MSSLTVDAVKASAITFIVCSWALFVSPEHKLPKEWSRLPISDRFGGLTAVQLFAGLAASLSLVILIGFTGVAFLESEGSVSVTAASTSDGSNGTNAKKGRRGVAGPSGAVKLVCCAVAAASVVFSIRQAGVRFMAQRKQPEWPETFGLFCGIGSVAVAQVCLMAYHWICLRVMPESRWIQIRGPTEAAQSFVGAALVHFSNPGAFLLLLPYLSLTWVFRLMPASYYDYDKPVQWSNVLAQLLLVDLFTFTNHIAEHCMPELYKVSHKPHHRFYSPQFFNAFDGSLADTIGLILIPLFATAQLLHVSNWDYIAFGTVYSTHFMLIHSEFQHAFDPILEMLFVNTAEDHHTHHAMQTYNYGHFFTIYDKIAGTYRAGHTCPGFASAAKVVATKTK